MIRLCFHHEWIYSMQAGQWWISQGPGGRGTLPAATIWLITYPAVKPQIPKVASKIWFSIWISYFMHRDSHSIVIRKLCKSRYLSTANDNFFCKIHSQYQGLCTSRALCTWFTLYCVLLWLAPDRDNLYPSGFPWWHGSWGQHGPIWGRQWSLYPKLQIQWLWWQFSSCPCNMQSDAVITRHCIKHCSIGGRRYLRVQNYQR